MKPFSVSRVRGASAILAGVAIFLLAPVAVAADSGSSATLRGPISGGTHERPFAAAVQDLAAHGYVETEYFMEGKAHGYGPVAGSALGSDGRWTVEPAKREPYATRILIRQPIDPEQSSGTLWLEWLQPTAGFDKDVNWNWHHEEYMRRGHTWVGVSTHHKSVDGLAQDVGFSSPLSDVFKTLVQWDPVRYRTLHIPSDDLSYDIYTQAARALGPERSMGKQDPLRGLDVEAVIAVGNTESADRLVTYYNAVHPLAGAVDGFLVESRYSKSAPLADGSEVPSVVRVRTDLATPIIVLNTDSNAVSHASQRQPPAESYRLWEVAGTSHTNAFWAPSMSKHMERDLGVSPGTCEGANEVPVEAVGNAAMRHLDGWARGGEPAPSFPPVTVSGDPPEISLDEFGNSKGGIRLPQLLVPADRFSHASNPGCAGGGGTTTPFPAARMKALYGSREVYLEKHAGAIEASVEAGVLLPEDAEKILERARARPAF
jgi:hypothetical protein